MKTLDYKITQHDTIMNKVNQNVKDWNPILKDFFLKFKSANTAYNDYIAVRNLLSWCCENIFNKNDIKDVDEKDLQKVKPIHIEKYLSELTHKIKKSSVSTKIEIFRSFWNYLYINDYVSKNIISCINKKQYINEKGGSYDDLRQRKTPTDDKLMRLLDALEICPMFEKLRNRAIIWTFCGTGIRLSEVTGLNLSDIDFNKKTISFLKKGNLYDKSTIGISNAALKAINDYLGEREKYAVDDSLFIDREGKRVNQRAIQYMLSKYSHGEITPHMLRHWVGTKLFEVTHDIKVAQEQLGHASYETTANVYVNKDASSINRAINGIKIG